MLDKTNKQLFIHVPKCMGSSIEKFILTVNNLQTNYYPAIPNMEYYVGENKDFLKKHDMSCKYAINHLTINDFKKIIDIETYNTFSIVRNPYTRFISAYLFAYQQQMTFDTFVEIFDKKLIYECELYLQPQINFVCDNSKNIIVNTILKFENPEEINKYLNNVYNSNIDIPHEKNNKKKDIQLTEKQKEKIYNFYIDDFLKFNYDK